MFNNSRKKSKYEEISSKDIDKEIKGYELRKQKILELQGIIPYGYPAKETDENRENGLYKIKTEEGFEGQIVIGDYIPTGETYIFSYQDREDLDQYISILNYYYKKAEKREKKEARKNKADRQLDEK